MQLTIPAQNQLKRLFQDTNSLKYFRIFVVGGGCSGFQYEFAFIENPEEDDTLIKTYDVSPGIGLVIDSISIEYLEEAILDYQRNLSGARFIITNPREQRACGCGLSVSF